MLAILKKMPLGTNMRVYIHTPFQVPTFTFMLQAEDVSSRLSALIGACGILCGPILRFWCFA